MIYTILSSVITLGACVDLNDIGYIIICADGEINIISKETL